MALRKCALLTRSDLVIDVVRSPSSRADRPGPVIHGVTPAAAASALAFWDLVTGSSLTTL